jgi:hypothetical protein
VCAPLGSDYIICRKYVDHSLERSLQGRKKQVKCRGELEMVYNVHKFMKTEYEISITISLSKVQKRVAEARRVTRRTLCRLLKEGENVETGVAMAFLTLRKLFSDIE